MTKLILLDNDKANADWLHKKKGDKKKDGNSKTDGSKKTGSKTKGH